MNFHRCTDDFIYHVFIALNIHLLINGHYMVIRVKKKGNSCLNHLVFIKAKKTARMMKPKLTR